MGTRGRAPVPGNAAHRRGRTAVTGVTGVTGVTAAGRAQTENRSRHQTCAMVAGQRGTAPGVAPSATTGQTTETTNPPPPTQATHFIIRGAARTAHAEKRLLTVSCTSEYSPRCDTCQAFHDVAADICETPHRLTSCAAGATVIRYV